MAYRDKKGQIEVTFNWVYILIAGAVILLFFFGLVFKQKAVSEQNLGNDLVRIMDSIFTGAGVSEKTKNFIDLSGLADYTLYFDCVDGVGEYGLKGTSARVENEVDPLFAPREIKGTQLIVWSLPYKLPYKVIDFLFVTSSNTKYFLFGGNTGVFDVESFMNSTEGFKRDYVTSEQYKSIDPGKNFQVRLVDLSGDIIGKGKEVPEKLQAMDNNKVTAVVFRGSNQVDYYQKEGERWTKLNYNTPVQIVSLGGERDAAKYAAIFAADDKVYKCNMQKAFKRLKYINEVYSGKAEEMKIFYSSKTFSKECFGYIQEGKPNLIDALSSQANLLQGCFKDNTLSNCGKLIESAMEIKTVNDNLGEKGDCITLY
ncbi:hypothetical protein HYX11_02275 [Candidatus Woesearchaeota archaeon]|nr:hypothetical protein [Candidatus Woesearchaeota archaeon]